MNNWCIILVDYEKKPEGISPVQVRVYSRYKTEQEAIKIANQLQAQNKIVNRNYYAVEL